MAGPVMTKNAILVLSILNLILLLSVFMGVGEGYSDLIFVMTLILVLLLVFFVFSDAKLRGKSEAFALLPLLLGGIGGFIYYFIIIKEKD